MFASVQELFAVQTGSIQNGFKVVSDTIGDYLYLFSGSLGN